MTSFLLIMRLFTKGEINHILKKRDYLMSILCVRHSFRLRLKSKDNTTNRGDKIENTLRQVSSQVESSS